MIVLGSPLFARSLVGNAAHRQRFNVDVASAAEGGREAVDDAALPPPPVTPALQTTATLPMFAKVGSLVISNVASSAPAAFVRPLPKWPHPPSPPSRLPSIPVRPSVEMTMLAKVHSAL